MLYFYIDMQLLTNSFMIPYEGAVFLNWIIYCSPATPLLVLFEVFLSQKLQDVPFVLAIELITATVAHF